MRKKDLAKKTKKELIELEAKLNDRKTVTKMSKDELTKAKEMVKHVLYECDCCLHAVTKVVEDADGESEYFISDCGDKVCRYRDEFLKIAEQGEKEIKEILANLKIV
jgi:hypothetical protein